MGKATKQTKKFQAKHLKHTIEQRRKVQKHNKLHASRGKKDVYATPEAGAPKAAASGEVFKDLDIEEFFDGGFEVPKESRALKKAKKAKEQEEGESESESEAEEEDSDNEGEEADSSSDEGDEAEAHENDLQDLEAADPEFYKYLKENDKDLLDFKPVNPLDAMSDSDDDEDDNEDEADEGKDAFAQEEEDYSRESITVTMKMVQQWDKSLSSSTPTIINLKNVVIAFKAAVNMDNEQDYKYAVTDEKVFNNLMIVALAKLPRAIQTLTPYKKSANGTRSITSNNKKISQISSILKSHASSLSTLLNDITNTETASLILTSVQELLPYYVSLRKILKELITAVVNVWSATKQVDTQISAFAFLNNVSREYPKATLELILKLTYSSFVKRCRQTNIHTMEMINFQKNSAAELYGVDESLSYQIGFEFIRQSAIHLRNSVNNQTKDSYKQIYNWQYCHSLDFWSRVIALHCNPEKEVMKKKESPLRQLIYPLVQVTLGAIRLIPTAQFFPLRFYLIRSLLRLSQNTGVFIPLFPLLGEILNSTALTRNPTNANLQAVDFDHVIKVNQQYIGTRVYQNGLCEQFVELASEFFVLHSKSIAFPELVTPVVIYLRRYIKTSKNVKFNKQLANLVEKLNQNAAYIENKRATVEFGPSNRVEVSKFLSEVDWSKTPLGAYVAVQRQVKEARAQTLKESILAEEEDRKRAKAQDDEDVDMGEGADSANEDDDEEEEE